MGKSERRPEDDPRFQRVREQLIRAVTELATVKPAEEITVSELTVKAEVARTTFYKHADSPARLLADHLIRQIRPKIEPLATLLDEAREDYLLRWREIMIELLEHARENERVYSHVFTADGQSVVLAMLSAYFEKVFSEYVESFVQHVDGGVPSELWVTMAISQQVHNLIVIIGSWLRTGMEESPEVVVSTYMSLAPPWQLAKFSPSGRTSLRRNRVVASLLESIADE
ncbi:TetR/AcrR family transcriptional regulator C-terminal domain-containing protein [Actinomycetaceae bacterium L2_0104]